MTEEAIKLENGAEKQVIQSTPPTGLGGRLVSNTLVNFGGQAILMLATFFWTPYIVRSFGDALFGVYVLLMTYVALFTLLELGINTSLVKHLAETISRGRIADAENYLGTAVSLFGAMAVVVALISGFGAPYIVRALNISPEYFDTAVIGVRIASVAFAMQFVSQGFASVPIARHRFDVVNGIQVSTELLRMGLSAAAVFGGYRLTGVMFAALIASAYRLFGFILATHRLAPDISLRPRISRRHLSDTIHFSKYIFVSKISGTLVWSTDKLVIGHFLPVSFVAFYSVPFQLCQRVWVLAGNVTTVVFPAASELSLDATKSRLHDLYCRSSKIVAAIMAAPSLLLVVFSSQILTYWINPHFAEQGSWSLRLLAVGFMLHGLVVVPGLVAAAVNKPSIQAMFAAVSSAATIVLFVILIPHFSTMGAAAAFFITQLVQWPWYTRTVNRLVGASFKTLINKVYLPVAIPSTVTVVVALLLRPAIHSLFTLVAGLSICMLANLLLLVFVTLDSHERGTCLHIARSWIPRNRILTEKP